MVVFSVAGVARRVRALFRIASQIIVVARARFRIASQIIVVAVIVLQRSPVVVVQHGTAWHDMAQRGVA